MPPQPGHPEPRPRQPGGHARPEVHARAAAVVQGHEDVVVDGRARSHAADLGVHGVGCAEEGDGLVDEVRPEVEEQAAAERGIGALAPAALLDGRPVAVEARLEPHDLPQRSAAQHGPQGLEVVVVPAVLEDREEHAGGLRLARQRRGVGGRGGEGLVDDDGQSRRHRTAGQRDVRDVRRGDDDEVDLVGRREQLVRVARDPHVRVRGARGGRATRVLRDDRGQPQPRCGDDERRVEEAPREAVADDRDPQRVGRSHGRRTLPAARPPAAASQRTTVTEHWA